MKRFMLATICMAAALAAVAGEPAAVERDNFCWAMACQELDLSDDVLSYWWMAALDDEVGRLTILVDGDVISTWEPTLADHLLDYQLRTVDISSYSGMHELCFRYDNLVDCGTGLYVDIFIDYVETLPGGLVNDGSFENGTCFAGSDWECYSCGNELIVDIVGVGLWNYDGHQVLWLKPYCDPVPVDQSSFSTVKTMY